MQLDEIGMASKQQCAIVTKYGETEYNNRVTDLIDRLLENPTTVNNHEEASSSISNDSEGNTY